MLPKHKHSSLLRRSINYDRKKFYSTDLWSLKLLWQFFLQQPTMIILSNKWSQKSFLLFSIQIFFLFLDFRLFELYANDPADTDICPTDTSTTFSMKFIFCLFPYFRCCKLYANDQADTDIFLLTSLKHFSI